MKRFKIIISYDGSNFDGYQKQGTKNSRTIQSELEKALFKISKKPIRIFSSGRTDKGVHALAQTLHFDCDLNISALQMKKALNFNLCKDIYIKSSQIVDSSFHSRFDCVGKEYHYLINVGEYNPFERNYIYQYNEELNIEDMKKCAQLFIGKHDFRNYSGAVVKKDEVFIKTIEDIKIIKDKNIITFIFIGNAFLRYMIRMIVGIIIEVGKGLQDESYIKKRLDNINKNKSNYKVIPNGLYLVDVLY